MAVYFSFHFVDLNFCTSTQLNTNYYLDHQDFYSTKIIMGHRKLDTLIYLFTQITYRNVAIIIISLSLQSAMLNNNYLRGL